jgi:hypothetical protein
MDRRQCCSALAGLLATTMFDAAQAQGLGEISDGEAAKGLKAALETGAASAVRLLGAPDGFLGNPKVHIELPGHLRDAAKLLKAIGREQDVKDLEVAMNRAAENAVPLGKKLLTDAVRNMTVSDAKRILTGGETSATQFFAEKTRDPLSVQFLPVVKQATSKVGLARKYDRIAGQGVQFGLVKQEDASIDQYVTRKALDGLYYMIGEEEKKIRRDPIGTGSALLGKVFGALR